MQTLRKKTSPLKYKNETSRFMGEGVSFKAKLIGILEVSEARGDRMCQEALSDLKMAIRAAGEHKQRITINIAIDGLRLRDEKTGDSLYHHPVHKISFIAQDMSDSRAFGYIFGSPDTGHRFFGIKTDKAASQVVIAMRDLFQVVFALKKKEIEVAKQHLDKTRFGTSPLFSDRSLLSSKNADAVKSAIPDTKGPSGSDTRPTPAVADLVDLELELNSLQQGLTQMERITPSDPFGSKDDPFGDSFTSFPQKPILPPPPSSGRERASRTSESGSLFSPKTPHTAASLDSSATDLFNTSRDLNTPKDFSFNEFNSSHDEPSSGDWFTPPASNSIFEEPPLAPEATKDQQHEAVKQEIMSQFDVFTELDPLGTETMNNLGTGRSKPYVDKKHFFQELKNPPKKVLNDLVSESQPQESVLFAVSFEKPVKSNIIDPFGEDPFDTTDPFAETDYAKQDVFEEFNEFKIFNNLNDLSEHKVNNGELLSKSPKSFERQISLASVASKTAGFFKQNTFDSQFDYKKNFSKLYENPSLDLSSESETAPEPPPRPTNTLPQIKPPPLPPKKQLGDLAAKPPPRPPHTEESHYEYVDQFETKDFFDKKNGPPIPAPSRKSKFESDFVPEEDYLTPVDLPEIRKDVRPIARHSGPVILPPPQKSKKKSEPPPPPAVTISSYLESAATTTITNTTKPNINLSLDSLDITLSQLTLSGLNELANKLNIPACQLSNMTLAQLTSYLSNFIKNATNETTTATEESEVRNFDSANFADFNNFNTTSSVNNESGYDRYAVFRELLQEEIKQTKIDTEPEEIIEEQKIEKIEKQKEKIKVKVDSIEIVDRYAALREIVESEFKQNDIIDEENENIDSDHLETIDEAIVEQNNINDDRDKNSISDKDLDNTIIDEPNDNEKLTNTNIIDYQSTILDNDVEVKSVSPVATQSPVKVKSPVPVAIAEIVGTRLTSGSLSDVVSGSSPEVDLTGSASENAAKKGDCTGESWAIFDQPNLIQESCKDVKAIQSEEGISPWSSDSKEFGNGSPPEWRQRIDSGSGGDQWAAEGRKRREEGGWWDTSAEPEVQYYPANRRSTDSYDDECYECYDRPRRRRQTNWSGSTSAQATGGHSSSSRDVSPWEEEPRRRDGRQSWSSRHSRQHSFERHQRDRRHADSWDEEDDYEYEDEHSGRFHWPDRHPERHLSRDEWEERRMQLRRRRDMDRERWCCPDYDIAEPEKPTGRYGSGRWSNPERRKHEERYYGRESQESPWEDEYGNEVEDPQSHYLSATSGRRTRIRPSSASEMDRKTGEIKSRLYFGGSDGERDRRYKTSRRSKSRDSQYVDPHPRHKLEPPVRPTHRTKPPHQKSHFETDFPQEIKKPEISKETNKKPLNLPRKKSKESPKTEEVNTFPRKASSRAQSLFENDFVPSENESPKRFSFENEFETSEAESPTVMKPVKPRPKKTSSWFETNEARRPKKPTKYKQKSLFEDDFSPSEKIEIEDVIPSIKEEHGNETEENVPGTSAQSVREKTRESIREIIRENARETGPVRNSATNPRKRLSRIANRADANLKKSESVNIFTRENDPFDDDFFSANTNGSSDVTNITGRSSELKWTEQFSDFERAK